MATSQTASAPMSGLAVTTPEASSSYYSYGTDVTPSSILGAKKGGSINMADGGLSDLAVTSLDYDELLQQDPTKLQNNGMMDFDFAKQHKKDIFALMGQFPGFEHFNNPEFQTKTNYDEAVRTIDPFMMVKNTGKYINSDSSDSYKLVGDQGKLIEVDPRIGTYFIDKIPKGPNALPSNVTTPPSYENQTVGNLPSNVTTTSTQDDGVINNDFPDDFPIRTMMGDTPLPYERVTTTNASGALPLNNGYGQTFSSSPTFRYSGANNPLLTGLRQGPVQQPYMLMPDGNFAPREELSTSRQYAQGGSPHGNPNIPMSDSHNPNVPVIEGRQDYREGAYVQGTGDGQSDDIPAMLADGEYVIDAETVAQLGNGSNKAGAKMLDKFRENIRSHKRNTPLNKIPPKSKSPLAYLKGAK